MKKYIIIMSKDRTAVKRIETDKHWNPGDEYWIENKPWIVGTAPIDDKTADFVMNGVLNAIKEEWDAVELTDPYSVIDALRGNITGDYEKDLKRLVKNKRRCSEELYQQAYQMDQQP